ncbi:MAG: 2-C-methyl-D-erythritol 4-phosphate cytidylyltransferase, partial [Thiothrix sp.]|nr:2-C-methyl-D-erythritol 4-phosphate cytidylyltransferase [Thiothrix sp.]
MSNRPVWVVIPAAGVGARMQADCPKQYLELQGQTVLEHTLDCFLEQPGIQGIVVVVSPDDPWWPSVSARLVQPVMSTSGGASRAESVLKGLTFLLQQPGVSPDQVVLVHDAARPCLPPADLALMLSAAESCADCGALLALPVRDTMKRAGPDGRHVAHTESRERLWHALTPQLARLGVLHAALLKAMDAGFAVTDEASALEYVGLHPRLLEGHAANIKITR